MHILAAAYVGFESPKDDKTSQERHQASLEARWKAGAMNAKQLFEVTGGQPIAPGR